MLLQPGHVLARQECVRLVLGGLAARHENLDVLECQDDLNALPLHLNSSAKGAPLRLFLFCCPVHNSTSTDGDDQNPEDIFGKLISEDSGEITIQGEPVDAVEVGDKKKRGVTPVYQHQRESLSDAV